MKTLKDIIIRHSTPNEHNDFMKIMSEGLHNEDPKVGIFWYNPQRNELFGVVALSLDDQNVSDCHNGKTCKILHKKKWQQDNPRGRVFYKDNKFLITVGSWINENENYKVIDLVEKEFNLTNEDTEIVEDSHWDIGSGWENL